MPRTIAISLRRHRVRQSMIFARKGAIVGYWRLGKSLSIPPISKVETFLKDIFSAKGMLRDGERRLLYSMAKHDFRGRGWIVDVGAYTGATAYFLRRDLLIDLPRCGPEFMSIPTVSSGLMNPMWSRCSTRTLGLPSQEVISWSTS